MSDSVAETYEEMAGYIREGKCVLILGPELSVDKDGLSYKSHFKSIADNKENGIITYFENENIFSFKDAIALKKTRGAVKAFYEKSGDRGLLEMIARIRFPLVINVCPDLALNEIYKAHRVEFSPAYFPANAGLFNSLGKPTIENPVLYNIFGSVETEMSLIVDHSKLFETIQYLLTDNSLPAQIEGFLTEASGFILLGLNFDSWHYQLICHKLKLKKPDNPDANLSISKSYNIDPVNKVMQEWFEISATEDNPKQAIETLISTLDINDRALRNEWRRLFVSYARKDEDGQPGVNRETFVDWTENYFTSPQKKVLDFIRDRKNLGYGDSIADFMQRIGKGKILLCVVSEKYLKSRYCMREALEMDQNKDEGQTIFNAIWEDVNLDDLDTYKKFWEKELDSIDRTNGEELDIVNKITMFLPAFSQRLKDKIALRISKNDFTVDPDSGVINIIDSRKKDYEDFINKITGIVKN